MSCLYISEPPLSIACWYCGLPCQLFHQDQILYASLVKDSSYSQRWEYHCNRHPELDIEVTCVQHDVPPPNWFFNRISITHKTLRLHWNFYAGPRVHLEYYKKPIPGKSGGEWKFISVQDWPPKWLTYPPDILFQPIEKIENFLKLYKVFS